MSTDAGAQGNDRRCARVFTGATGPRTGDVDSQSNDHRSRPKFEPAAVHWLARLPSKTRATRGAAVNPTGHRLYLALYQAASGNTTDAVVTPWQWLALIPVATLLLVVAATGLPARLATRIRTADALRFD
jgi:hypothetical protein